MRSHLEAEQSLLGAVILDNTVMDDILPLVDVNCFSGDRERLVFRAMRWLYEQDKPIDLTTLAEALGKHLDEIGGIPYLTDLDRLMPSVANVPHYAEIVRKHGIRRRALQLAAEIQEAASDESLTDMEEFLADIEQKAMALRPRDVTGLVPVKTEIADHIDVIGRRKAHEGVIGTPTGIPDFDALTGGLQGGWLVILAARPSMGKTALALQMAVHAARVSQTAVAIFSTEMKREHLYDRILANLAMIPLNKIKRNTLSEHEYRQLVQAASALGEANLHIDDTPGITMDYIAAECRRLKRREGKIGLVVIDYLTRLKIPQRANESRTLAVGRAAQQAKNMAIQLDCPVLMLAQLNRQVENRADKKPNLSDLRDSGEIEQEADIVAFLHEEGEPVLLGNSTEQIAPIHLVIEKGRDTGTGVVKLGFRRMYQKFVNLAKGE